MDEMGRVSLRYHALGLVLRELTQCLLSYVMTVTSVIGLFMAWTLIPSNIAGRTKRTVTSSFTFVGYCVGNIVGSQIFNYRDAVSAP